MQKYKWILKAKPAKETTDKLQKDLNIAKELSTILAQRDVIDFESAKNFFRPKIEHLHDPFLMKDMEEASTRLAKAILEKQKILVYGDYDVDGTTSVAMMSSFIRGYHNQIDTYIPNRYDEGYGISQKGIEYAIDNEFNLMITLDCGIKSVEKLSFVQSQGIDVIICDHHEPSEKLPKVLAVLDPKRKDCKYPFKELSGCGVGFKLIQACLKKLNLEDDLAEEFLDLLCLSISADMVSMMGENRILAHKGLEKINISPRFGIKVMLDENKNSNHTISDLVFGVAPKINAAGRITHAKHALNLLDAKSNEEAEALLEIVSNQNQTRRELDESTLKEALLMLEESFGFSNVLYNEDWNKGILGIVASRVIENSYKPTIVLTKSSDGLLVGSARSVKGFDLYNALEQCDEYIEEFGGHKYAAGLKVKEDNLLLFKQKFDEAVQREIKQNQTIPSIEIDCEIDLDTIDEKFIRILQQMGPFGPDNLNPYFFSDQLELASPAELLGKDKTHLRFEVKQINGNTKHQVIAFGIGHRIEELNPSFGMVYSIKMNYWKSRETLQLVMEDFKQNK